MARTFIKQTQSTGSVAVTDNISLTEHLAVSGTLQDNLNALRTALRAVIGAGAYDGGSSAGFWHTGSANGVSLAGISTDISGTWKVNSLFVSGVGASTVSGTLTVETLNVTGSSGLTVSNGMTISGDTFEMTGSMFVSSSFTLTGSHRQLVVPGDSASYFLVSNDSETESFTVDNASPGGHLSFRLSGSQMTLAADTMVLGTGSVGVDAVEFDSGASTWTSWYTEFGTATSLLDAIIAVSTAASGAAAPAASTPFSASIKGPIPVASAISSGSWVAVQVFSGSGYTFVTPTYGGNPSHDVDIFINGVLMSGSNYQTQEADWYWDESDDNAEGGGANRVNFSFNLETTDNVQVILRDFQLN